MESAKQTNISGSEPYVWSIVSILDLMESAKQTLEIELMQLKMKRFNP